MIQSMFISMLFVISTHVYAQSFKVVKIQGKKAIVEVSDISSISLNETYQVGNNTAYQKTSFKRDHAIDASFSYLNQTSSPSSSILSLSASYLWNFKKYEIGPLLQLVNTSSSGFNTSSTSIGALGYYNFNENKPGVEGVISAVGQFSQASGSGSSSTTSLSAGANYRWFILSGDHCFSLSALYRTTQGSGSTASGIILSGGIATYF